MSRAIPAPLLEILQSTESDPSASFTMEGYCVRCSTSARAYYVKVGEPEEEEQYHGEAISIQHITRAAPGLCPAVLRFGIAKFPDIEDDEDAKVIDKPFWVSEYRFMHPLDPKSAGILAKRMALELHAHRSQNGACDGEASPNFCRNFEINIGTPVYDPP
jgi:protein-ribulosamine 3-kinase